MNKGRELQLCYLDDWLKIWEAVVADDQKTTQESVQYHARRLAGHSGNTVAEESKKINEMIKKHWPEARDNIARIKRELRR